MDARTGRDLMN
jgi:hypothetical protein